MSFPLCSVAAIKEAQAITGALTETDMSISQDCALCFVLWGFFHLYIQAMDCFLTNVPSHEPSKGQD